MSRRRIDKYLDPIKLFLLTPILVTGALDWTLYLWAVDSVELTHPNAHQDVKDDLVSERRQMFKAVMSIALTFVFYFGLTYLCYLGIDKLLSL